MKNIYIIILLLMLLSYQSTLTENYYVNVYDDNETTGWGVYAKSIDLDNRVVQSSVKLSEYGVIVRKKPISINFGNQQYLISFSETGGYNKNSQMGLDNYIVYYSILTDENDQLNEIVSDSIVGVTIGYVRQFPSEEGFRFGLRSDDNTRDILPEGIYNLRQNFQFNLRTPVSPSSRPGDLHNICGFNYLHRISWPNIRNLFYAYPYSYKIIKLNNNNSEVLDTLQIPKTPGQIIQIAYHSDRDKMYVFHLNYEIHGKFMDQVREPDAPEPKVMIYDPETFELLETHIITDYPEGNYPSADEGISDVVGDFIVYYFFDSDWIGKFNPALLFIFDTRTNEANWLPVGWR